MKSFPVKIIKDSLLNKLLENDVNYKFSNLIANSLIKASVRGVHSHGIALINRYLKEIKSGIIEPNINPEICLENAVFAISGNLDSYKGFGQVGTLTLIDKVIDSCKSETSLISLTIRNCNHIGDLKQYAEIFNKNGFCFLGVASAGANVGLEDGKKVGTNPFCLTIPIKVGDDEFIGCDLATSVFPEGKVRVAKMDKENLPNGVIFNSEGQPSNNPNDLYKGGWLRPFGGYKGFAMGASIDLFLGYLGGATNVIKWDCGNNAQFFAIRNLQDSSNLSLKNIQAYFKDNIPSLRELISERDANLNGIKVDLLTSELLGLDDYE